jgi:acetolactate synthase-1/2/3 large subunit
MSTAAQLIVKCLENEGVSIVFGIPGEENIRLIQALAASDIRYVLTRHEQAAAFMAEMYGRVTGRAGVVSATLGPGAINMQLGVADATTNSTPVVAISAQVGQDREYKESHQSVDLVSMYAPITRWAAAVPTPKAIPEMIRKAFKLAETERPAAVYLAIPEHIDEDPVRLRGPPTSCARHSSRWCWPATVRHAVTLPPPWSASPNEPA